MNLEFSDNLPENLLSKAICISGRLSWYFDSVKYLLQKDSSCENFTRAYEIRYQYHCSPFKQAEFYDNVIAVGFEDSFYLFDHTKNKNLVALQMEGYFGSFHFEDDGIYICDSSSLCCIDFDGNLIWRNKNLGIDGVIISEFQAERIIGSGEWDPPGGWRDFSIDRTTGMLIQ